MATKKEGKKKKCSLKVKKIGEVSFVGIGGNQGSYQSLLKIEDPSDVKDAKKKEKKSKDKKETTSTLKSFKEDEMAKKKVENTLSTVEKKYYDALDDDGKKAFLELKKEETMISKEDHEKVKNEAEVYKTLSTFTDIEKNYYDSLDDKEKEKFLKLDDKKRSKEIEKSNEDDETFESDGRTIRKSVVGDDTFYFMKSQQEKLEKSEKIAKEEREKRIEKEYQDKAESEYPNLPGNPIEKGKFLRVVESLSDEKVKKVGLSMLKSGDEAMIDLFKEIGAGGTILEDSPEGKLNKMAEDISKAKNISFAKAYTEALETEDGQKLYEETLK